MRIACGHVKPLAPLAAFCQQIIMKVKAEKGAVEKERKLAEALRENLRRRKLQDSDRKKEGKKTNS